MNQRIKTIDLSTVKNGNDFLNIIKNNKGCVFNLLNENQNSVLRKINQPENKHRFKIGDTVKLDQDLLDFNGVKDNNTTWTIVGMEQVDDQFLYVVKNQNSRYEFFGYELQLVRR